MQHPSSQGPQIQQPATGQTPANIAFLGQDGSALEALDKTIQQLAPSGVKSVHAWMAVERFRAPSSTHPPYRGLARQEARNITAERIVRAEAEVAAAMRRWSERGWQATSEVILDLDATALAARLDERAIDLLVCDSGSALVRLAEKVASQTGLPLLLLPQPEEAKRGPFGHHLLTEANPAVRLLRAIHG